jgi:hypothetical protein
MLICTVALFLSCKLNYTYLKSENTVNCDVSISPVENLSVSASLFYKDKILPGDAVYAWC